MRLDRLLFELLGIPAPPGQEGQVAKFCQNFLNRFGFDVEIDRTGNVIAQRGQGTLPLLNAHLDDWGAGRKYEVKNGVVRLVNGAMALGGDDKCGVAVILHLAATTKIPFAVLLTIEEEVGGRGVQEFIKNNLDYNYSITIDRKGSNQVVVKIGDVFLPNWTLLQRVYQSGRKAGINPVLVEGVFADCLTLRLAGLPCVNISAGYFLPHNPEEFIHLPSLRKTRRWVENILCF